MSERTVLLCPRCGSNLGGRITTKRTLDFSSDDIGRLGLFATGPKQYWQSPGDGDSEECSNLDCKDEDCDNKHNFDPQRNQELLADPLVEKVFTYDWDYQEEYDEDLDKIVLVYCTKWDCSWDMTVTEHVRNHVTLEDVG